MMGEMFPDFLFMYVSQTGNFPTYRLQVNLDERLGTKHRGRGLTLDGPWILGRTFLNGGMDHSPQ